MRGRREGQALPPQPQHSTTGPKVPVSPPPTPAPHPLSLAPLVHDDKTDMSVYFVIRTLECL